MRAESVFDSALPDSYNSAGIPFMPDDIDTADVTHAVEIKVFQRTPMVTALIPGHLHNMPFPLQI
jgi:hypothetical protein